MATTIPDRGSCGLEKEIPPQHVSEDEDDRPIAELREAVETQARPEVDVEYRERVENQHTNESPTPTSDYSIHQDFEELRDRVDRAIGRWEGEMAFFRTEFVNQARDAKVREDRLMEQMAVLVSAVTKSAEEIKSMRELITTRINRKASVQQGTATPSPATPVLEQASRSMSPYHGNVIGGKFLLRWTR